MATNLFTQRKRLDQICTVPERIISVYALEDHVWDTEKSGDNRSARQERRAELQTIEEFQISPVRAFLTDIFRNIGSPNYNRTDNPVGQGYWIQAEFGSGKSHLLCFLAALALGDDKAWQIVDQKERKAGRGKRDSLASFWQDGLSQKSQDGKKGIFVIVKTLVGSGGGTVGLNDQGKALTEYILDAAKSQLELETGKNISLYPSNSLPIAF